VGTGGATLANHSFLSHGFSKGHHKTMLMCVVFDSPQHFLHEDLLSTWPEWQLCPTPPVKLHCAGRAGLCGC